MRFFEDINKPRLTTYWILLIVLGGLHRIARRVRWVFGLILIFSLSLSAIADDKASQPNAETMPSPLSVFVTGGAVFGAGTTYTIQAGNLVSPYDEASEMNFVTGGEVDYRLSSFFQLAGVLEYSKYNKGGGFTDDSEYGFYLMPRFEKRKGLAIFWGGLGLGLVDTAFGQAFSMNALNGAMMDSTAVGFAISPRVGVDFEVAKGYFVGLQATFTSTWAGYNGVSGGAFGFGAPLHVDFNRRWFSLGARVGLNF